MPNNTNVSNNVNDGAGTQKAPAQTVYTDSQLHDIFVSITNYLMDTGHVSVGDSAFTKKMSNFLSGNHPQDDQNHGNHHHYTPKQPGRYDPSRAPLDIEALADNLRSMHVDPNGAEGQIIIKAAQNARTVNDLLGKLKRPISPASAQAIIASHK